jgi:hypothetical protein
VLGGVLEGGAEGHPHADAARSRGSTP